MYIIYIYTYTHSRICIDSVLIVVLSCSVASSCVDRSACHSVRAQTTTTILLYYTIPYYDILYYTILHFTKLYYTILYYSTIYYTILYYTRLSYELLYPFMCEGARPNKMAGPRRSVCLFCLCGVCAVRRCTCILVLPLLPLLAYNQCYTAVYTKCYTANL